MDGETERSADGKARCALRVAGHTIWGWRNRPIQFRTPLCGSRSWGNECETERQRKVPNNVSVMGTTEELLLAKLCWIQNYSWRETMREWLYIQPQAFYSDVMTELLDFWFKLLASWNVARKIRRVAWLILEVERNRFYSTEICW